MKVKKEAVFQFASPATTIELLDRLLTSIIYESLKLFFHNLLYVFSLFIKILNRNQIEPVNDKVRNLS